MSAFFSPKRRRRQPFQTFCALPLGCLALLACRAHVHMIWNPWVWCPDISALLPTCSACWMLAFFANCVASLLCILIESIEWFQLVALRTLLFTKLTRCTCPRFLYFHTVLASLGSGLVAVSARWITTSGTHVHSILCVTCVGGPGKLWSRFAFSAFGILAVKTLPSIFEDATSLLLCFPAFQKFAH